MKPFIIVFFCLSALCSSPLRGTGIPVLPLQSAEAEHVDFDERVIHLVGHVKVVHEIGVLCCDEGTLLLPQEKVDEDHSSVDTILLSGHVDVVFSDGSHLVANEGIIDCQKQEGTFLADPPDKVTYTGLASGDHRKIPVRATGRALKANISKTESGYTLTSLRGEGAVNVEYYTPTESEAIAATVSPSHTSENSFDHTSTVNPEAADPQIPFSGEDAS